MMITFSGIPVALLESTRKENWSATCWIYCSIWISKQCFFFLIHRFHWTGKLNSLDESLVFIHFVSHLWSKIAIHVRREGEGGGGRVKRKPIFIWFGFKSASHRQFRKPASNIDLRDDSFNGNMPMLQARKWKKGRYLIVITLFIFM